MASQEEYWKKLGNRVSASITWIRDGFMPTDTTG
jgi:hypothetical protein